MKNIYKYKWARKPINLRWPYLCLFVCGAGLISCDNGSALDSSSGRTATSQVSDGNSEMSEMDEYVRSRIGYTLDELEAARTKAIELEVKTCMFDAGWSNEDYQNLFADGIEEKLNEAMKERRGRATSWAILSAEAYNDTKNGQVSLEAERSWTECKKNAWHKVPNPWGMVNGLLNQWLDYHNDAVAADPDAIAAEEALASCLEGVGMTESDYSLAQESLNSEANAILDQMTEGLINHNEVISRLRALNQHEIDKYGTSADCYTDRDKAIGIVSDRIDLEIIENNLAVFEEMFNEVRRAAEEINS